MEGCRVHYHQGSGMSISPVELRYIVGALLVLTLFKIFMPLIQGMAWTLIVAGWRHWNTATKFSGQTTGAKIRRWWWNVNNWSIPMNGKQSFKSEKMGTDGKRVYTRT